MIRTSSVKLTVIPAIAYKEKHPAGGSAIVILRADATQPGIATISKTSGEPIIASNTPAEGFPKEAFEEAIALTSGMPYYKKGKPTVVAQDLELQEAAAVEEPAAEEAEDQDTDLEDIADSAEYKAILYAFTDKNGKISYEHVNKEMIQFAHSSEMVGRMIAAGESDDAIRLYIVGTKFRNISGNKDLTDEQVLKIAELIDEASPKGIFKELNAEIRSMKGAQKKKR
ncbi:MAG: hypothetical protein Q4C09_03320 [Atopobiaceae bacterium]|nr:hypothetical protein [Atopobiaceae bacterium]